MSAADPTDDAIHVLRSTGFDVSVIADQHIRHADPGAVTAARP